MLYKITIFFLLLSLGPVIAQEHAKIIYLRGDVKTGPAKGPYLPAIVGEKVPVGHILKTDDYSVALISITNDIKIKINENSLLKMTKSKVSKNKKRYHHAYLKTGSVFIETQLEKLANKKESFIITTKTSSFATRGTKFFVAVTHPEGNEFIEEDSWMCVENGEVVARNRRFGSHTNVKQGEGVILPFGKNTTSPKTLISLRKLNWSMNPKWDILNKVPFEQVFYDLLDVDYD